LPYSLFLCYLCQVALAQASRLFERDYYAAYNIVEHGHLHRDQLITSTTRPIELSHGRKDRDGHSKCKLSPVLVVYWM
jgi:hypothetical protein